MLGLADAYTAYCFDQAVYRFGTGVEEAVEEAAKKKTKSDTDKARNMRAQQTMNRLLGLKPKFAELVVPGRSNA